MTRVLPRILATPICLAIPLLGFFLATLEPAHAQDLEAYRLGAGEEIELDGRILETAWENAIPITDFTQKEPVEGGEPSERTEIWAAISADALYIGAVLYDDPAGILAFQKGRDKFLSTDDRFMWILDTFGDGRTGYFFETNAAGLLGDQLISGSSGGGRGGGGGRAWDGIWNVKTFIRPDGWSLEIEIPFRTLNFDPNATEWGINFQRTIRRKNEEIVWRGFRRNQELRRPVHAGKLTGLEGLTQGLGLEATPYVVTNWRNVPTETEPTTYPSDIGLDVNYNLTPSLKAAVSVNTDFAEAEVDDRRLNLTRFPQRFPERRDFFIEGSGVFSFAPRNGVEPFFSRKIGLLSGQQIPIDFASRLSGQAGRYELGFLHVQTAGLESPQATTGAFPSEQFSVARVKRSIFEQSSIGAVYTRRTTDLDPTDPTGLAPLDRHTAGIDLNLFTSTLFGDKNFQMEGFFVWNSNPSRTEALDRSELSARGIRLNYPNDLWSGHVSYRELGDHYSPAAGFVTRNNFRRVEPRIGFAPRPDWDLIRQLDFSVQFRNLENLKTGVLEERQWEFQVLGINFESQDRIDFNVNRQYEFLDESFEISDSVFIQPGQYTNWEWGVNGRTASRRRISADVEYSRGGFWNGDRQVAELGLDFRPRPGIQIGGELEHNEVTLPQGAFTANLMRLSGDWDISPWASVTGNIQYDDVSEVVGLFARTRWILQPGNELFVVLTHNWQNLGQGLFDRDREFVILSRGASIKLNYTLRL